MKRVNGEAWGVEENEGNQRDKESYHFADSREAAEAESEKSLKRDGAAVRTFDQKPTRTSRGGAQWSRSLHLRDPPAKRRASSCTHTHGSSPLRQNPSPRRSWTSFLAAVQDALALKKFNRKKPLFISTPSFLPDIIEITATETKRDNVIAATQEAEEREQEHDAAVCSSASMPISCPRLQP